MVRSMSTVVRAGGVAAAVVALAASGGAAIAAPGAVAPAGYEFLARLEFGTPGAAGSRACTGVLIGPRAVLTARNCAVTVARPDPLDPAAARVTVRLRSATAPVRVVEPRRRRVRQRLRGRRRDRRRLCRPADRLPGRAAGAGLLYLFAGGAVSTARPNSVTPAKLIGQVDVYGTDEDGDRFGAALAAADLNRDGKADAVLGSPGEGAPGEPDTGMAISLSAGF
jgi:hypothetical protein